MAEVQLTHEQLNLMGRHIVLYHGNCADGFVAAWAVWKVLGGKRESYVPIQYGDVLKYVDIEPEMVQLVIVDFSFKRNEIEQLLKDGFHIIILDHHQTAKNELEGNWQYEYKNLYIEFDMQRSGAGMAWDFYHREAARPLAVQLVEDRDLWRFAIDGSKEFHTALTTLLPDFNPTSFMLFDNLLEIHKEAGLIEFGRHFLQYHMARVVEIAESEAVIVKDAEGNKVFLLNAPYFITSDIGNYLCSVNLVGGPVDYACVYRIKIHADLTAAVSLSFRSIGFDTTKIAEKFHGGGHVKSSGGWAALEQFANFFNLIL